MDILEPDLVQYIQSYLKLETVGLWQTFSENLASPTALTKVLVSSKMPLNTKSRTIEISCAILWSEVKMQNSIKKIESTFL